MCVCVCTSIHIHAYNLGGALYWKLEFVKFEYSKPLGTFWGLKVGLMFLGSNRETP